MKVLVVGTRAKQCRQGIDGVVKVVEELGKGCRQELEWRAERGDGGDQGTRV